MQGFRFQHIELLTVLALIPLLGVLFFFLLQWKKKVRSRIGEPALVQSLLRSFSPKRFAWKFGLALGAFALLGLGLANPQRPGATDRVNRKGVDVMVALDVSNSMLAQDSKPNRLEKAKQLLLRMLDKMENDRIGIVLFAGRAYMQMPLTSDQAAARMYIQNASPDVVPVQGTVIGEALKVASTAFNSKERKYKAIVLISDGEDHDPEAATMAQTLAQKGIMVNTVGLGSPEGATIIDPSTGETKKDAAGNAVVTKLNEAELQQLAAATHGIYLRLEDPNDAANKIQAQLATIEQASSSDKSFTEYKSYFQWLLGGALALLLLEFFIPERKKIVTA